MNDDGKIQINTEINTSGTEKGIKSLTEKLNKLSENKTLTAFSKLGNAVTGLSSAFGLVSKAAGAVTAAIKNTTAAYKADKDASIQLDTAVRNNPYLKKENADQLKEFANQLSSVSTVAAGDMLPVMAQLAASGRTQAEIMDVMSASLDIAASGTMSLEQAAESLNKTYNGNVGLLGNQYSELKNLTDEQLRQGKAVEILGGKYKGVSEEMTKATGAGQQMENAWSDLQSSIGNIFTKLIAPVQKFVTAALNGLNAVVEKMNEILGIDGSTDTTGMKESEKTGVAIKEAEKKYKELSLSVAAAERNLDKFKEDNKEILESIEKQAEAEKVKNELQKENNNLTEAQKQAQEELKKAQDKINENNIKIQKLEIKNAEQLEKRTKAKTQADYKAADAAIKNNNKTIKALEKDNAKQQRVVNTYSPLIKLNQQAQTQNESQTANQSIIGQQVALQKAVDDATAAMKEQEIQIERLKKTQISQQEEEAKAAAVKPQWEIDYDKTLSDYEKELSYRKSEGEIMSEEGQKQEYLNTLVSAYIKARKDAGAALTDADPWVQKTTEQIKNLRTELHDIDYNEVYKKVESSTGTKLSEDTKNKIQTIDQEQFKNNGKSSTLNSMLGFQDSEMQALLEFKDAYLAAYDEINGASEESAKKRAEIESKFATKQSSIILGAITDSLSQVQGYLETAFSAHLENIENESSKETEELQFEYEQGLMDYDEYLTKKNELDKETAQKEYRIKMAEWTMNLAMATAQGAQAVINALATGEPPINTMNAVAAGILAAAQIATIAGSKPVAPSFSTGGFLTGDSTSGDKIPFMGNAGEAILNPAEMRNFMDMANGNFNGGAVINMPITIENNASDAVSVSANGNDREIKITVDKIVNSSLQSGTYNTALSAANNSQTGARYL